MKTKVLWLIILVISASLISGCTSGGKYERQLKHELARGVRCDSIFMGLYFGMSEKEFYVRCWKLNHQGLVRQGESNSNVLYQMKSELQYPANMEFYPAFKEGKIYEMPVRYYYQGWTPWNKKLSADNLEIDLLKYFEKTYGKGFIKVVHPKHGTAWVKVDGNRRITIFKEDDYHVWADFVDMLVKNKMGNSALIKDNFAADTTKK